LCLWACSREGKRGKKGEGGGEEDKRKEEGVFLFLLILLYCREGKGKRGVERGRETEGGGAKLFLNLGEKRWRGGRKGVGGGERRRGEKKKKSLYL